MNPSQITTRPATAPAEDAELLERARGQCMALLEAEERVREDLHMMCRQMWELGKTLFELKEIVGHGKWMFYVAANFPMLGGEERSRCNRANDAKAFFEANPNYPSSGNFTIDSIRKCVFHLAPEKERPSLPGNAPITPAPHQLTFVNNFFKWDQRIKANLDPAPPVEVVRRDLGPVIKRIAELAGPGASEWIKGLVE